MRIAVDAFGGDHAPDEIIKGCILAAESVDCEMILVGDETIIRNILMELGYKGNKICVHHASEVIDGNDAPVESVRRKKDSSMVVAQMLCKNGMADAVVSAGNTGAYLAGAFRYIGRIKGIRRPALTTFMPSVTGKRGVLLDTGANVDCKPEFIEQFAQMGSLYAEKNLGIENPKVYLLNIGTEEHKGNEMSQKAYELLKANEKINFCGNIESRDLIAGFADVIVCDGFTGNVAVKSIEGTASALFGLIKQSFMKTVATKISSIVMKAHLKDLKSMMDYTEYGGVPLLGVDGTVIKAHGSSNAKAICNAIKSAAVFCESGTNEALKEIYTPKNRMNEAE